MSGTLRFMLRTEIEKLSLTTCYALSQADDQDKIISNGTSTGIIKAFLPVTARGLSFGPFYIESSGTLRVYPNSTADAFMIDFTSSVSTDRIVPVTQRGGAYLASNYPKSFLFVRCHEPNIWQTVNSAGPWTVATSS